MKPHSFIVLLASALVALSPLHSQNTIPGSISFKRISGDAYITNTNTGSREKITESTSITQGYSIQTTNDAFLDVVFSNGVAARVSPNTSIEIVSFSQQDGRAAARKAEQTPSIKLILTHGDIVVNATQKPEGAAMTVETPLATVSATQTKFFVSHGSSATGDMKTSRAINLGVAALKIETNGQSGFSAKDNQTFYITWDAEGTARSQSIDTESTAIILQMLETPERGGSSPAYSVTPYDYVLLEKLSATANSLLLSDPSAGSNAIVLSTLEGATFLNTITGATGTIVEGMEISAGTILRTPSEGRTVLALPNEATLSIEPSANLFLESMLSHLLLSGVQPSDITRVGLRVEAGKVIANTLNAPSMDFVAVISPLDQHRIGANSLVSVEFLQVETNAFQTISRNDTPAGVIGISTTVVTSNELSYTDERVTFIEYRAEGGPLSFNTPPGFTHITESAIIPPGYDFIDRTIAFAAPADPAGPTPIGTPDNPGDNLQNTEVIPPSPSL
ncbi:MAG: FecR domain-containing protein [Opitutales bacterium]|nr:FecR domain-containing protein [Opitutales bacterium]